MIVELIVKVGTQEYTTWRDRRVVICYSLTGNECISYGEPSGVCDSESERVELHCEQLTLGLCWKSDGNEEWSVGFFSSLAETECRLSEEQNHSIRTSFSLSAEIIWLDNDLVSRHCFQRSVLSQAKWCLSHVWNGEMGIVPVRKRTTGTTVRHVPEES